MSAYAERFVRSIRSECLDQMIFLGRAPLDRAIEGYAAHYHEERSHQGIGNELISGAAAHREGVVAARERLGGLLSTITGRRLEMRVVYRVFGQNAEERFTSTARQKGAPRSREAPVSLPAHTLEVALFSAFSLDYLMRVMRRVCSNLPAVSR